MLNALFSFKGRVDRSLYWLVVIFASRPDAIVQLDLHLFILVFFIPLSMWVITAQSVKRAHDVGLSGWWTLFPPIILFLVFKKGQEGANIYGEEPV